MRTSATISLFIISILCAAPAKAADQKPAAAPAPVASPAPAASTAPTPVAGGQGLSYKLRNLKPIGLSQQTKAGTHRQLMMFRNDQGKQSILYEEVPGSPAIKDMVLLAPFLASVAHTCSIDLQCKAKAFCTSDCTNLFYELSNNPSDPILAEKSNCTIQSFTCSTESLAGQKKGDAGVAALPAVTPAAAPAPAPAPAPAKGP